MLRLYFHPASTYARRVHIVLLEKQIPFQPVVLDMAAGQHRQPEYRALNPYGRVPTIEEDGFVLYESAAIVEYLEATRPTPPLVPPDVRGRALVAMHSRLCDLQMGRPMAIIIFPKRFLPRERWDEPAIARAAGEVEKHLAILETQLSRREFLVGDRYTLADIAYIPFLEFLPLAEIQPPPAVAAWSARLLSRPTAVQTRPAH